MPSTAASAGALVFTLVAAVAFICALRRVLKDRGQWSLGAAMRAFAVVAVFSFVQLFVTYTGTWVKVTDVYRDVSYETPPWAVLALRGAFVLTMAGALTLFVAGMRRRDAVLNIPAVLLTLMLAVSMASSLLHGDIPLQPFSLVYLCILLATVFAPRGFGIHLGVATVVMIIAVTSGFALLIHSDFSAMECTAGYKCGILGFRFRGVFDNENAFAMYLGLAMPFVYMAFRGWEGIVMATYLAFLVVLTGSRSGTLTAAVTLATLLVMRPDVRHATRATVRSIALGAGLLTTVAVGLALPIIVSDTSAFSGRADLWRQARIALADPATFIYGTGMFGWQHVHEQGWIDASAVYSVHNQWLHVLFSTGIIGLACFLGAIGIMLWQARNTYFLVIGTVLMPYTVLAVTERPWPIDTADWLAWTVPAALLCYPAMRPAPDAQGQATSSQELDSTAPAPPSNLRPIAEVT